MGRKPATLPATTPLSKLRPPHVRHAEVTRHRLLDDDGPLSACEVLAVCAPAGYGKSTFAVQWASRSNRPVAWATLDESDNDPVVLLGTVNAALAHATDTYVPLTRMTAEEPTFTRFVLPAFASAVAAVAEGLVVVLDDVHVVDDVAAQKVLRTLVDALPIGSQVAFIGRSLSAIPLPLWRGQGRVVELHAEDLMFSAAETAQAFEAFGRTDASQEVHRATGGWPVAVFLLSQAPASLSMTNVSEFIETEVLDPMSDTLRDFVMCTAALGSVNTQLASAASGSPYAARFLSESLTTVLISRGTDGWYRYHPLLQDTVLQRWHRDDPSRLTEVLATAARWYADRGMLDTAVTYALRCEDGSTLGPVVWSAIKVALLQGRTRTAMSWLSRIDERTVAAEPELSMSAAWANVAACQYGSVLRHLQQTLSLMPADWRDHIGDFSIGPDLALLLAVSHHGVADASEAARLAAAAHAEVLPTDPIYPLVTVIVGINQALVGDPSATTTLNEAAALAAAAGIASTQVEALALLGIVQMALGQQSAGCDAVERALEIFGVQNLDQMVSTTGVVALAKVAMTCLRGRDADVRAAVAQQASVASEVQLILGWYKPLSGGILALASLRLGDLAGYHEHISWCGQEAVCQAWQARARREHAATTPLAVLTPAELRVWELLKGRLTLSEIAGALYLSRETVKSHTGSIYRKLGVASRRDLQDLAERWG